MAHTITRNDDANRYEIVVSDELAGVLEYRADGDALALTHTEVYQEFSGRGLASELVSAALDDIRDRGVTIVPLCPYVVSFLEKNPEYRDLVA